MLLRRGLIIGFIFLAASGLHAQIAHTGTGGSGLEANGNSLNGTAAGIVLYYGYNMSEAIMLGGKFITSSDLWEMSALYGESFMFFEPCVRFAYPSGFGVGFTLGG